MTTTDRKPPSFRLRFLAALTAIFIFVNLALRLALALRFSAALPLSANLPQGVLAGLVNDAATLCFVLLPAAVILALCTNRFLNRRGGRFSLRVLLFLFCAVCVFDAFAEYYFWEEFTSRLNFIAVDYLIYTTELFNNMLESYPMFRLLAAIFLLSLLLSLPAWKWVVRGRGGQTHTLPNTLPVRLAPVGGHIALAALLFVFFSPFGHFEDRNWSEFSKNGLYEMFSAFRHNQLDYRAFYTTMNKREAFARMRAELENADPTAKPHEQEAADNLVRQVSSKRELRTPNVVLVIMESMGSKWLGEHTPNLNQLAAEGLSFSNMMSTGTRTVRGIEAIMLSVPPTPGNSIVRRPDNDELFSLGTVFREKNYEQSFIYGGIGYFDNMNDFFAGNGFKIVDKLDFAAENKTFSNAWGQCDEDLYAESLSRADQSFSTGKPFLQVLLTTSNHRPFTYPEGKVELPAGESRRGAVQYSDHAIGVFMDKARKKLWFEDTVFVFIGDHPSSVAGKTEVPADAYGIICVVYGPQFFKPERVDTLCSQIDLTPTLLSALGWEYRSQFFGSDARALPKENGRAWISTYQLLGFRDNERLVVLKPNGAAEVSALSANGRSQNENAALDDYAVKRAVASYQCAYDLFVDKGLKERAVAACSSGMQNRSEARKTAVASATPGKYAAGSDKGGIFGYQLWNSGLNLRMR